MGRTQRNQWLAEFESGTGHLENPLFLADVTMPLYGHSKGALCLRNAVRHLPPERYAGLCVTTLGCVVVEETPADYNQILGTIDGLGQLNSWGALPEQWVNAWHSTKTPCCP